MKMAMWLYGFALAITIMMFSQFSHAGVGVINRAQAGYQNVGTAVQLVCESGISCQKVNATGKIGITLSKVPYSAAGMTRFSSAWLPGTLTSGTSITGAAGSMFLTQLYIPHSINVTGITVLNGTPCGTDKYIVYLIDYSGKVIANSATAGVTCTGAGVYQAIPFTAVYPTSYAGTYWIGVMKNGTTDAFMTLPAVAASAGLAGVVTGFTFGTIPATVTVPTTFTADKGPIAFTY